MSEYYIGVMSGTSLDAIDCCLVDFDDGTRLLHHYSHPIPSSISRQLFSLTRTQDNEIDKMAEMDVLFGHEIAHACLQLLQSSNCSVGDIKAIGSHGQTIRHYPGQGGFSTSLQIGDPNIIAQQTGITVVADFRRRDMAAGGQGAPLVPPFHAHLFQHSKIHRTIVNIGGIANISVLPPLSHKQAVTGYDTGPGNSLLDRVCQTRLHQEYDCDGNIARSGTIHQKLLQEMLSDKYFQQPAPKSTGREYFGDNWLEQKLEPCPDLPMADILATLVELTAISISSEIMRAQSDCQQIIVCGGGSKNSYLVERLAYHANMLCGHHSTLKSKKQSVEVLVSDSLGVPSQWIEGMAFAWLARQTMMRRTGNLKSVTGARHEVILGAVYYVQ